MYHLMKLLILKWFGPETAQHHIDFDSGQFGSIVSIKRLNDTNTETAHLVLREQLKVVDVGYGSVCSTFGGLWVVWQRSGWSALSRTVQGEPLKDPPLATKHIILDLFAFYGKAAPSPELVRRFDHTTTWSIKMLGSEQVQPEFCWMVGETGLLAGSSSSLTLKRPL